MEYSDRPDAAHLGRKATDTQSTTTDQAPNRAGLALGLVGEAASAAANEHGSSSACNLDNIGSGAAEVICINHWEPDSDYMQPHGILKHEALRLYHSYSTTVQPVCYST